MSDNDLRPQPVGTAPKLLTFQGVKQVEPAEPEVISTIADEKEPVITLHHPFLVANVRHDASSSGFLSGFLDHESIEMQGNQFDAIEMAFCGSSKLTDLVDPLVRELERRSIDPNTAFLALLKNTEDVNDKAVLAAVLILRDLDFFVSDFVSPVMEERPYFENLESNKKFCLRFLDALDEDELRSVFCRMDFSASCRLNPLAKSLSELKDPELVLSTLLDIANDESSSLITASNDDYLQNHKKRIHKIVVLVMKSLKKADKPVPSEPLKTLYATCDDSDISDEAIALFETAKIQDEGKFLLDLIKDDSDMEYEARRRRFWAISDYATRLKEKAVGGLKRFISQSDDSFLVSFACYELVNRFEKKGQNALASVIYEQVTGNRLSIPLAYVGFMMRHNQSYVDIFKSVLSMNYSGRSNLALAYSNLDGTEITKMRVGDNDLPTFYAAYNMPADTIVDIFTMLGLRTCIQWAMSDGKGHTYDNVLDLIQYGYRSDGRRMSALVTAQLEYDDPEVNDLLFAVAGIRNAESEQPEEEE